MSEGDNNFFSRWSRRKAEVRQGVAAPEPVPPAVADAAPAPVAPLPLKTPAQPDALTVTATPAPPPPTLADVDALTTQSDYTRFVSRDVAPEVKQAALKKLFTDPHFNVMDGLDTYIDDYGQPDPLPPGMLRKMMQSQLLGLFDHEKKAEGDDAPAVAVDIPAPQGNPDTPAAAVDTAPPPLPIDTAAPDAGEAPAADATLPKNPNPPPP